jgi:hypothetical protein
MNHPIQVTVTADRRRARLTAIFRPILAIPLIVWGYVWGIAAIVAVVIAWFAALITGRVPDPLHHFISRYLRFGTQALGYTTLLGERYPGFLGDQPYEVDASIAGALEQSRAKVAFRLILAVPLIILAEVLKSVAFVIAAFAWVVAIFTEELHPGFRNIGSWLLRFYVQTYGYVGLLTERYPHLDIEPRVAPSTVY